MLVTLSIRDVAIFGSVALLLAACAAPESRPGGVGLKLTPAALGESISLQQRLDVEGHGRSAQLDVVLEVDAARIDLVGLVLGQRVLSLSYDGRRCNRGATQCGQPSCTGKRCLKTYN